MLVPFAAIALLTAPASPVVSSVRVAAASRGMAGPVIATLGGRTVTIAARGWRAWRAESGRSVLFLVSRPNGPASARSLCRWEARTGSTTTLVELDNPLSTLSETRSTLGRTIFLVTTASAPVPTTLIVHPVLGTVYRAVGGRPALQKFGMVRLERLEAVKNGKPRVVRQETLDFDVLVNHAFQTAPFVGTFATANSIPSGDGGTLQIRRTLRIDSDGAASLTSTLSGPPPVSTGTPSAQQVRRRGRLYADLIQRGGTLKHQGTFRPFPKKADAPLGGAVFLTSLGDNKPAEATISIARAADGSLNPTGWDLAAYGEAPPPFTPVSSGTGTTTPPFPAPPDIPSPAAPYLGTWQRMGTDAKRGIFTETLELTPDRAARRTTRYEKEPAPVVDTGTWVYLLSTPNNPDPRFIVRLTDREGKPLPTADRIIFTVSGDVLEATEFDRILHGAALRFTRSGLSSPPAIRR